MTAGVVGTMRESTPTIRLHSTLLPPFFIMARKFLKDSRLIADPMAVSTCFAPKRICTALTDLPIV